MGTMDPFRSKGVRGLVPSGRGLTTSPLPALDFRREDVEWFRAEARRRGVAIHSPTREALQAVEKIIETTEAGTSIPARAGLDAASMVSVCKLARLVSEKSPSLATTMWELLKADTRWTLPMKRSRQRDMMWEIVVAAAALRGFEDVSLSEPDVTCSLGGSRWGIACKVSYAAKPDSVRKRIWEGIDQIERANVRAGAVVVNVTGVLPHKLFWQTLKLGTAIPAARMGEALATFVRIVMDGACDKKFLDALMLDRKADRRTKVRSMIFVGQCIASTSAGLRVLTFQRSQNIRTFEDLGTRFANRLHLGWKDI